MKQHNALLCSFVVGTVIGSVAGFALLAKSLHRYLSHKRHKHLTYKSLVKSPLAKGSRVYHDSASINRAQEKLVSALNNPKFRAYCIRRLTRASLPLTTHTSQLKLDLSQLCSDLDKLNIFVIRSRKRTGNK